MHWTAIKLAVWLIVAAAAVGQSAVYYVDPGHPNASDANAGTNPSAPWMTLARVGSQSFLPGEACLLRAGRVWHETLTPTAGGIPGAPLTFGVYGTGPAPVIDPASTTADGVVCVLLNDVVFEGLHVRGGHVGYNVAACSRITIRDGEISGLSSHGILAAGSGSGIRVERCHFHDILGDCISAFQTDAWVVRHCLFEGVPGAPGTDAIALHSCFGVSVIEFNTIRGPFGKTGISCAQPTMPVGSRARVTSNLIMGARVAGVMVVGADSAVTARNNVIVTQQGGVPLFDAGLLADAGASLIAENNTVVNGAPGAGPSLEARAGCVVDAKNNISFITSAAAQSALHWRIDPTATVTASHDLYWGGLPASAIRVGSLPVPLATWSAVEPGAVVADPLFAGDPASGLDGVRLTPASAAIDAAASLAPVFGDDVFGTSRGYGAGWDIGAHEFISPMLFRGTNDDFLLYSAVGRAGDPAAVQKSAAATDMVAIGLFSPGGAFLSSAPVLLAQVSTTPDITRLGATIPGFGLHLDPAASVVLVGAPPANLPLTAFGLSFHLPAPFELVGYTAWFQGAAVSPIANNGVVAFTDAHAVTIR